MESVGAVSWVHVDSEGMEEDVKIAEAMIEFRDRWCDLATDFHRLTLPGKAGQKQRAEFDKAYTRAIQVSESAVRSYDSWLGEVRKVDMELSSLLENAKRSQERFETDQKAAKSRERALGVTASSFKEERDQFASWSDPDKIVVTVPEGVSRADAVKGLWRCSHPARFFDGVPPSFREAKEKTDLEVIEKLAAASRIDYFGDRCLKINMEEFPEVDVTRYVQQCDVRMSRKEIVQKCLSGTN